MFSSYLPIVMQKLGEAEVARAEAKRDARRAPRTDVELRSQRFLRVPRLRAKGPTRRPAGKAAVRST
jgi:hypothetical protein